MFAWEVFEDDHWSIIAMSVHGIPMPMVTSKTDVAKGLRNVAELHKEKTGLPVRLVWFNNFDTVETL
jgi:hypothetical protein